MPLSNGFHSPDPALLEGLRTQIRKLEKHYIGRCFKTFLMGDPQIDAALPRGGLPRAALHQVVDGDGGGSGAALGFCTALLARLSAGRGTVLWCRRRRGLYGPGLSAMGLDPTRLIIVRGRNRTDILWAMEEGLRSGALAAVLGEADGVSPIALRRLQLAAETGGATALLLTSAQAKDQAPASGPVTSRWRVWTAPSSSSFPSLRNGDSCRWRVELMRCRNGSPGAWRVEWRPKIKNETTHGTTHGTAGGFAVAADLPHRSSGEAMAKGGGLRRTG